MAVDIVEHAVRAADPYDATRGMVSLSGQHVLVGESSFKLAEGGSIYVLGAGKATLRVAQALEEILGSQIRQGLITIKRGQPHNLRHIRVIEAGHPYPDQMSYLAARETMELARSAGTGDIVFTIMTGGSSALLCYPADSIAVEEKRRVHRLLLHSGANILEINSVRKHLSRIKGGLLAQAALPAQLINLTVSDVIGDPLDYIAGPVVPDTSSVSDAVDVLRKYELWDEVSQSVRKHLCQGAKVETPKSLDHQLIRTFVLVRCAAAAEAAATRAGELGLNPLYMTSYLAGESSQLAVCLGAIVREIVTTGRPVAPPCAVVASGESTTTVPSGGGTGGPSQELALTLAVHIDGLEGVAVAVLDTDGTDGPTEYAGALVDGSTVSRARKIGLELSRILKEHNSTPALSELGDIVYTGPTGTNVAQLVVIVIGDQGQSKLDFVSRE